ncbi:MAG: DUF523 domain-containing protein [Desulfocapsaceae bacterium]|nr:DUF523 domain-containing protein [Desulfocapsaceae bacterium]
MDTSTPPKLYLVSSCLVGLCTRYDGKSLVNVPCQNRLCDNIYIPVCPEQLGGLTTPREAADIISGDGHDVLAGRAKVITKSGVDVTAAFIHGAKQVLHIASSQAINGVFLKARSPSCAVYNNIGVTAALLQENGFALEEF